MSIELDFYKFHEIELPQVFVCEKFIHADDFPPMLCDKMLLEGCDECRERNKIYFPPITDGLLINLLLCINTPCPVKQYITKQDKQELLVWIMHQSEDKKVRNRIRDILIQHVSDYTAE